ncbi:MAG: PucR family transcriptional regulator [Pseudonocardiales bacterium]
MTGTVDGAVGPAAVRDQLALFRPPAGSLDGDDQQPGRDRDSAGGPLEIGGADWAWAYPLVNQADMAGHLVVSRDTEPEPHHQLLLTMLVQQTGVALANARLHARERVAERAREAAARERATADELRIVNLALEQAITELARSSAGMQRSLAIHDRLTAVALAGEGQPGIAQAVHELTGLSVAVEDRHGNLTAWVGPGQPEPYPKPTPARRAQTLRRAQAARAPVRDRGRLIVLANRAVRCSAQATVFDDLGVYQLLSEIADVGSVESLIRRWLGALLDYDATKGAQLVETLRGYLKCGGNYDRTAKTLSVHRSTLRYRLQRIREVSGHDLNHPDTRFNLQLATRAWTTVHAMRQHP